MPTAHKTLTSVARALGFSAHALANWRAQYDDAPRMFAEDEWKAFIAKHDLGNSPNRTHRNMQQLRELKMESEIRINKLKIARAEGRMIPVDTVNDFLLHIASRTKSAVYQHFVTELPPKAAGHEPAEIRKLAQESADSLVLSMQDEVSRYIKEQAAARPKLPDDESE